MLNEFIDTAVSMGAMGLEIENKDSREWIFAMRGQTGIGIDSIESKDNQPFFDELAALRRKKQITVAGQVYRLRFSIYESFGEWVHRIDWEEKTSKTK